MKSFITTLFFALLFAFNSQAQQCPSEIEIFPSENCLSYYFSLNGDAFGNVIWDFSDAGAEDSGIGIDHTFPESGTYTICANPMSMDCDPICITIDVLCADCDLEVLASAVSDSVLILQALNIPDDAMVNWSQNGELVNVGEITTFILVPGANQICAYYTTDDCPEGVEWCENFYYEEYECPTGIAYDIIECGLYEFYLEGASDVAQIFWTIDGNQFITSGATSAIELAQGAHEISVVYMSPQFPECNELTFSLELLVNCEQDFCPNVITYFPSGDDCLTYTFGINNMGDVGNIIWHWGDSTTSIGSNFVNHTYTQFGEYDVCVEVWTGDCPEGVEICMTVFIPDCEITCPGEIVAENIGCGLWVFSVVPGNSVTGGLWSFGDGTFADPDGNSVTHQFDEPGVYEVTVNAYLNQPCFNNFFIITIEVEECNDDCPSVITYTTINECGIYLFNINNFGDFGEITWFWGDGAMSSGGNNVGHAYFEPGNYEVCAEAWTAACPEGVEICIPLVVPDCEIECPGEIVATELECGLWEFSLEPGSAVMGAVWSFGDGNIGESNGNSIIHQFDSTGVFIVTVNSSLNQPCFNNYFILTMVIEECGEEFCPDEMIITQGEYCGSYNFTVNNTASIDDIVWYWGDGFVGGGNQLNAWHNYQEAGEYEVCASITAEGCPNSMFEICQIIVVPECPDCPTEIVYVQDSCNVYTFWLDNAASFGQIQWNFGGNQVVTAGNSAQTVTLEPGENIIYAVYTAPNNPECSGQTFMITIQVPECDGECPTSLNIQQMTCGYFYFMGWNNSDEVIIWSYSDGDENYTITTSNNGFISHMFMNPGSYDICAVYYSENCEEGIELCETIVVPDCNPDDCTITLTYSNLGNGFFNFIANGSEGVLPLFWDYGNGNTMNATWVTQHQFEPGTYTVCVSYDSTICTFPVTTCVTIIVPEPEECEGYLLSFQSQLTNAGLSVVTFSLTDANGVQFQGGTFFVSDVIGFFEGEVCLPDGCYTLDLTALEGLGINISDLELLFNGLPFDGFVQIVQVSNTEVQVQIDINGDCDFSTGINDDILADIQVYPVPAIDMLNIVIPAGEMVEATILSTTGQIIYRAQLNQSVQLNTTNWASGLYLLKLENNYSTKMQRIQKF